MDMGKDEKFLGLFFCLRQLHCQKNSFSKLSKFPFSNCHNFNNYPDYSRSTVHENPRLNFPPFPQSTVKIPITRWRKINPPPNKKKSRTISRISFFVHFSYFFFVQEKEIGIISCCSCSNDISWTFFGGWKISRNIKRCIFSRYPANFQSPLYIRFINPV
jgi:hypothetical protein